MSIARYVMMVIVLGMGTAQAQPPIPSKWEGKAIGHIRGIEFSVPNVVEITQALPHEQNPFHLFVGSSLRALLFETLLEIDQVFCDLNAIALRLSL
ncbi:MAG: hypothetical protein H6Q04_1288 [Acidobacteria bacterium]|nr:hypothetical protein [Acidobacteriota bacterium]